MLESMILILYDKRSTGKNFRQTNGRWNKGGQDKWHIDKRWTEQTGDIQTADRTNGG